jgi:hypothetical protein
MHLAESDTCVASVENVSLQALRNGFLERVSMFGRLALILSLLAIGLALNGCTRCGPFWDDWMASPKSCKSDHL